MPKPKTGRTSHTIRLPLWLYNKLADYKEKNGSYDGLVFVDNQTIKEVNEKANFNPPSDEQSKHRINEQTAIILEQEGTIKSLNSELETVKGEYQRVIEKARKMNDELADLKQISERQRKWEWRRFFGDQ